MVLSAICASEGGSSVGCIALPSGILMVWQCTQPYRASILRPRFNCGVPVSGPRWHCPQEDWTYRAGRIGCSHASGAAVRFFDGGRRALPTVTHHAAVLVERVRNHRMLAKRLRTDIGQTRFFQSGVASGAAIDDSDLRQPDLLDPIVIVKVALQCDRVSAARESAIRYFF